MHLNECFNTIVEKRRAVRSFSKDAPFDHTCVDRSIARAVLAPSSNNMQLWQIFRVKSPLKLKELAYLCLNQRPATTAIEMVVFVCRYDLWKERADFNYKKILELDKDNLDELAYYKNTIPLIYSQYLFGLWGIIKKGVQSFKSLVEPSFQELSQNDLHIILHKSCALAASTFMLSISAEGYDTCPMEGFDSRRVKKFLNLPSAAQICMIISVGPGDEFAVNTPRIRVALSDIYKEV
ncbi:MAG: nitroreductase family protein [Oligoflexia bacterium]|nr:nitroreductase family protein [Oligoflexia bacterium]